MMVGMGVGVCEGDADGDGERVGEPTVVLTGEATGAVEAATGDGVEGANIHLIFNISPL
jgi:hypothetical protein